MDQATYTKLANQFYGQGLASLTPEELKFFNSSGMNANQDGQMSPEAQRISQKFAAAMKAGVDSTGDVQGYMAAADQAGDGWQRTVFNVGKVVVPALVGAGALAATGAFGAAAQGAVGGGALGGAGAGLGAAGLGAEGLALAGPAADAAMGVSTGALGGTTGGVTALAGSGAGSGLFPSLEMMGQTAMPSLSPMPPPTSALPWAPTAGGLFPPLEMMGQTAMPSLSPMPPPTANLPWMPSIPGAPTSPGGSASPGGSPIPPSGGGSMFDPSTYDWTKLIAPIAGAAIGAIGSKGGDQTTQTSQVSKEFSPLASEVAARGSQMGNLPYTPYSGMLTQPFNPYQNTGFDMTANRAQQSGGLPAQSEAALSNVLSGGSMGAQRTNPYADSSTSVGSNPYAGANPYLEQNIQNTLGDITRSYNQNVAPSMAATAYKSGSFGNTGQAEMEAQSRNMLQQNLGRVSGDMRMQDYGMQQGLAESDITRRMNAQAGDYSRNASTYGQQNALNQAGYESGQGRMMQGLGYSPSIYGLGYQPAQQMLGIGATVQQQGQNDLNAQYGQFQNQQNWPFKTYDAMLAPFNTRAVGTTQTNTGPQGNLAAGMIGGAMLGQQLYNGYNQQQAAPQYPWNINGGWTGGH